MRGSERKKGERKKAGKRVVGVVAAGVSVGRLISPPPGILLYGNRTPVRRRELAPEAGYLPTASANRLHRAMRRDATRRVASRRGGGKRCRVSG